MPDPTSLHLPRPASLVVRLSDPTSFRATVKLYATFLGTEPVSQGENYASFQVGAAQEAADRDIELRLELHPDDPPMLADHTLLYWAIAKDEAGRDVKLANAAGYTTAVDAEMRQAGQFLLADKFNNFFGGHPNPPFPPGVPGGGGPGFLFRPGFLAGLLSGLVLGGLLVGAAQARRGR